MIFGNIFLLVVLVMHKMIPKHVQAEENVLQTILVNVQVLLELNVKYQHVLISQQIRKVFVLVMESVMIPIHVYVKKNGEAVIAAKVTNSNIFVLRIAVFLHSASI